MQIKCKSINTQWILEQDALLIAMFVYTFTLGIIKTYIFHIHHMSIVAKIEVQYFVGLL